MKKKLSIILCIALMFCMIPTTSAFAKTIKAKSVSVSPKAITIAVGDIAQLNATKSPSKAKDKLIWTSSDDSIATVTSKGLVQGVSEGSVSITVQTSLSKKTDECIVTVSNYLTASEIEKLIDSNAVSNEHIIDLIKKNSLSNDDVLSLIENNTLSTDVVNSLIDAKIISEKDIISLIKNNTLSTDAVNSLIDAKIISENDIITLIKNNSLSADAVNTLIDAKAISEEDIIALIKNNSLSESAINSLIDAKVLSESDVKKLIEENQPELDFLSIYNAIKDKILDLINETSYTKSEIDEKLAAIPSGNSCDCKEAMNKTNLANTLSRGK